LKEFESLWFRLLDRLDDAGLLSPHSNAKTPAEIGAEVQRRTGDNRVATFVWSYYYPHAFGDGSGSMNDREAGILIDSFKRPPKEDLRSLEAITLATLGNQAVCNLCGKQHADGELH
jgi:hypothetical protein